MVSLSAYVMNPGYENWFPIDLAGTYHLNIRFAFNGNFYYVPVIQHSSFMSLFFSVFFNNILGSVQYIQVNECAIRVLQEISISKRSRGPVVDERHRVLGVLLLLGRDRVEGVQGKVVLDQPAVVHGRHQTRVLRHLAVGSAPFTTPAIPEPPPACGLATRTDRSL